jgi:phage terminase small subunit
MKLSSKTQKLKKSILSEFRFDDEASFAVLKTTLEAFELMNRSQEQVNKEGLTVQGDRGGIKAHPLLSVIRDQRAQFFAGIKALKLDIGQELVNRLPGRPTSYDSYKKGRI